MYIYIYIYIYTYRGMVGASQVQYRLSRAESVPAQTSLGIRLRINVDESCSAEAERAAREELSQQDLEG